MDRVARRGLLARAPDALKKDTSEIVNIFVAVEGGALWRKNKFWKKVSQSQKTERGTLTGFSTSILFFIIHFSTSKQQKIEGGTLWGKNFPKKKSRSAEKN